MAGSGAVAVSGVVSGNVIVNAIRAEISSSNFPHFARNPNTGTAVDTETRLERAEQTIFHSALCPSHLMLPVIPADHDVTVTKV